MEDLGRAGVASRREERRGEREEEEGGFDVVDADSATNDDARWRRGAAAEEAAALAASPIGLDAAAARSVDAERLVSMTRGMIRKSSQQKEREKERERGNERVFQSDARQGRWGSGDRACDPSRPRRPRQRSLLFQKGIRAPSLSLSLVSHTHIKAKI